MRVNFACVLSFPRCFIQYAKAVSAVYCCLAASALSVQWHLYFLYVAPTVQIRDDDEASYLL